MLSRPSRWISFTISFALTFVVIGAFGCRSARQPGKLFQVTQHDSAEISDEGETPRQRLASAKPRAGSVFGNGEVVRQQEDAESAGTRQVSHTEETDKPGRTIRSPGSQNSPLVRNQKRTTTRKPIENANTKTNASEKMSDDELVDAFAGTSSEVKEQALRQLVAVLSRNAETTDQPSPLGEAITKSLKDQHNLPPAKNEPASEPVNRLATPAAESQTKVASTTDSKNKNADVFAEETPKPVSRSSLEEIVVETFSDREPEIAAVKTVSATQSPAAPPMVKNAAMQSASDLALSINAGTESLSDRMLYQTLLKRVSKAVEGETEAERARRLITARHLMVLAGNPDAAVEGIEGMTDKEQEYLRHQLLGLWTMVDPDGHPVQSRRFSSALPQLREATKYLAAATDSLDVRSLAFCTEIMAYGQVKRFESKRFKPSQQVILYCEVENFVAKKVDDGFQTHLQGSYDILNSDNQKVASQLLPADQQVSANYLRDYFIAYQMHLPQDLDPGAYRLQLTMEDVEGKKYGQATISFEIGN
ncbi:hypothetical protein CA13_46410 [Planctomycetes bacterium CA13]|uniref:Uncharacterized protein n=2 Tax=Novipirellula herctigrandis TaxID=2527986 RepID=A0A5C5Z7E7_9BACT|nr:hypothetical protein CA13_46410 [Planctomycetes bacterium CA13]